MAQFFDTWRSGGTGNGPYTLSPRTTGEIPLSIDLLAGQTAVGFRVRNSAGTVLFSVDPSGNITAAGTITVTVNEIVTGNISLTGTLSVTSTSAFTGNVTMAGALTVTGATTFGTASSGDGIFNHNLTVQNQLTVNGEAYFNSPTFFIVAAKFADGTAAIPSISFISDPDTGFYRAAANTIGFAINGVFQASLAPNLFILGRGDAGTPAQATFRGANSSGTDINSASTIVQAGLGTGIGTAGTMIFQIAVNGGTTGAVLHTASTIFTVGNTHAAAIGTDGLISMTGVTYIDRFTANLGTAANTVAFAIGQPTFQASAAAITETNAATVYIAGAPVKSTNVTMTNTHGLLIAAGGVSTATNSYGLTINAQTGASNNYAAQLMGGNVGIGIAAPTDVLHIQKNQNAPTRLTIENTTDGTGSYSGFHALGSTGSGLLMIATAASFSTITGFGDSAVIRSDTGSSGGLIIGTAGALPISFAINDVIEVVLNATNFQPNANDGNALGVSGTAWADLFLASGGVINWVAGDVTLTHAAGGLSLTSAVETSGVPTLFTLTGAANTGITAATEDIGANFNFSATKTWAAGAGPLATQREVLIQAPTYVGNAAGALTISDASTFDVSGPPVAGANMTISRPWAARFGGNIGVGAGTAALPSYSFTGDTDTGMYSNAANKIGWSVNGAVEMILSATDLTPGGNDGNALGTSSLQWSDLFLATGGIVNWGNGNVALTHAAANLTINASAATDGSTLLTLSQGAHTGVTANRPALDLSTVTLSLANAVTLAASSHLNVGQVTFNGVAGGGTETVTDATSIYVAGAPIKGTNLTMTNTHGIYVAAGAVGTANASYGLTVNAQTGAANRNACAQFLNSGGTAIVSFGSGDLGTPGAGQIQGAQASGTNIAGANLIFLISNGTGTGNAGVLSFQGAANGGTTGITNHTTSTLFQVGNVHSAAVGTTGAFWSSAATTHVDRFTAGAGTAASTVAYSIGQSTFQGQNAITMTNAMNLYIAGAPIKSTNATVTNTHALYIDAGAVSTATNSFGLTVNAQTGAVTNYAAAFLGGNVGIGTATPNIAGGSRVLTISTPQSGEELADIELQGRATTGTNVHGNIRFYNTTAQNAFIRAIRDNAANSSYLEIGTAAAGVLSTLFYVMGATPAIVWGSGEAGTPTGRTLRGADAAGTNIAGATSTLRSGLGTGIGGAGVLAIQSAANGFTTGSTAHTAVTLLQVGNVHTAAITTTGLVSHPATTYIDRWTGNGTVATTMIYTFGQPTIQSGTASTTSTDAATVYIAGAPIKSTNALLTNTHGLYIAATATVSTASTSYGLTVLAQTGATTNNVAQFLGGSFIIDNQAIAVSPLVVKDNATAIFSILDGGAVTHTQPYNYAVLATADNIAYTFTLTGIALTDGVTIHFRVPAANSGGAVTLNVNAAGAKKCIAAGTNVQLNTPTAFVTDGFFANLSYTATYSTAADAAAGAWIVSI